jgi:hypothetical protein
MNSNKYFSFFLVAVAACALTGCTDDFDGTLKVASPFSLTKSDGTKTNISLNQTGQVSLSNKVEEDGTYHDALILNNSQFNFSVAKGNVDPSGNHAQADANSTGQGIGLDAVITPNSPVSSETHITNEFCPMTNTCWHIVSQQTTVNGTTQTSYNWDYGYDNYCPGSQEVQIETDYIADQLNVKFSDASGKVVATFSGFGQESYTNKVVGSSQCMLNEHYISVDFRPNYQPTGPNDYR